MKKRRIVAGITAIGLALSLAACSAGGRASSGDGGGSSNDNKGALVGVAAARTGAETRIALAGAAPVPWLLASPEALEQSTPLPGTAYKVEIARALVRRAVGALH